jgi:hypothetical protein
MIDSYDPQKAPNPKQWLKLEEKDRINLIYGYHVKQNKGIPDIHMHSLMHNIVENQVAMGNKIPVKKH